MIDRKRRCAGFEMGERAERHRAAVRSIARKCPSASPDLSETPAAFPGPRDTGSIA